LVFTLFGADSVMPVILPREPPAADEGLLNLPDLENTYRYVLFHFGPLQVTRKGVNLALNSACLMFTVLQAAHLTLCTTTPEDMAAGMRWYLRPLCVIRAPIDEIVFTVLLSLRFTSIVFEEIRNISLGLAARGVQWRLLGWRGTVSVFSSLLSRTLESLFITSAAVADAITARGYMGAGQHRLFSPERGARGPALGRTLDVAASVALAAFSVHFAEQV
jgi:general transcription factor 3C polypeptide 2